MQRWHQKLDSRPDGSATPLTHSFRHLEIIWASRVDNYCRFLDRVNLELAKELAGMHGNNSSDKCGFIAGRSLPEIHLGSARLPRAADHPSGSPEEIFS